MKHERGAIPCLLGIQACVGLTRTDPLCPTSQLHDTPLCYVPGMHKFLFFLLILVAPLTARAAFLDCLYFDGFEGAATFGGTSISAAQARNGLEVHNCARKTVVPAATNPLPLLTWDAVVASSAQSWADKCVYAHGGHAGYGQNIYAAAGFVPTLADASLKWASEQPDYDYASNTCAPGKVCGHYTQIVWRNTTRIGCGQATCSVNSPFLSFPNWHFIVCNYAPPGNYIGQRPY